jgi:hypothetical protein
MSFTTMTFEDLKYTHENQKYNIPQTEDEDYGEFFNMMGNFMDFSNYLNSLSGDLSGDLSGYKNFDRSKATLLKTYDKTKSLYNTYAVDESEKIRKIKEFFDELNNINSATYRNNAIRPIL